MLSHTTHASYRPGKRNKRRQLHASELLEQRQMMTANAVNFEALDSAEVAAFQTEMFQAVDELADTIRQEIPQAQIELQLEAEDPMLLLESVDPQTIQSIVDGLDVDGLGSLLSQDQQLAESLSEMVVLELVGVSEDASEYLQAMDLFIGSANCQLGFIDDIWVDTSASDDLPREFEQLRQELGDEGFANWLQSNAEQFGNLIGMPESAVRELDENAQRELERTNGLLDKWLGRFDEQNESPVEWELIVPMLPGDANADGVVGFEDFLSLSENFGTEVASGAAAGDFNLDGIVDFPDFLILSGNFGANVNQQVGNIGFGAGENNTDWMWAECTAGAKTCGYALGNAKADWQVKLNKVTDKDDALLNGVHKAVITYRFKPNGGPVVTRTVNRWVQFTNGNAEVSLDETVAGGTVSVQKVGVSYRVNGDA